MPVVAQIGPTTIGGTLTRVEASGHLIDRITRAAVGGRIDHVGPNPMVIKVHPILGRALAAARIDTCEGGVGGDKLSERQLAKLMEGREIGDRIELKRLVDIAGLSPR